MALMFSPQSFDFQSVAIGRVLMLVFTPRSRVSRRGCRRRRRGRRAHAEPSCAQRKLMSCHVTPS